MADTLTVTVKLFATLKKYLPPGKEEGISLTLPAGSTVLDVIDALKIPHEQATMLVAGDTYVEKTTPPDRRASAQHLPAACRGARR